jgi:putative flavoprotein involved in K+ transport
MWWLSGVGRQVVILDDQQTAGGAWPNMWPSLRLFSPAEYALLPGWPMPPWPDGFPPARHVIDYLTAYEQRYNLPVLRPVRVRTVILCPEERPRGVRE